MFKIGLLGNPNSGKSSLFNQLTGLRQKVGNFPGVTVDKKVGVMQLPNGEAITIIHFPGTYSLHPNCQDERVVLNIVANPKDENYPDAVIYVADTMNLEKHLLLFTQLQDLNFPMILALSMGDLAEKEGLKIFSQLILPSQSMEHAMQESCHDHGTATPYVKSNRHRVTPSKEFHKGPMFRGGYKKKRHCHNGCHSKGISDPHR